MKKFLMLLSLCCFITLTGCDRTSKEDLRKLEHADMVARVQIYIEKEIFDFIIPKEKCPYEGWKCGCSIFAEYNAKQKVYQELQIIPKCKIKDVDLITVGKINGGELITSSLSFSGSSLFILLGGGSKISGSAMYNKTFISDTYLGIGFGNCSDCELRHSVCCEITDVDYERFKKYFIELGADQTTIKFILYEYRGQSK